MCFVCNCSVANFCDIFPPLAFILGNKLRTGSFKFHPVRRPTDTRPGVLLAYFFTVLLLEYLSCQVYFIEYEDELTHRGK